MTVVTFRNAIAMGLVFTVMSGCEKKNPTPPEQKPSNPTKQVNPYIRTADDFSPKEFELVSEVIKARNRAQMFTNLVNEYENVSAPSVLEFSRKKTLDSLIKWKIGFETDGVGLTHHSIDNSGIREYKDFPNLDRYWKDLYNGLRGYGGVISGNMPFDELELLAKEFCNDIFYDSYLITGGKMKGYFCRDGDLVVPGIKFYQGVSSGQINLNSFNTTPFFWQTQNSLAFNQLLIGNYSEGKKIIEDILKENRVLPSLRWSLYFNKAFAELNLREFESAFDSYASAYFFADESNKEIIKSHLENLGKTD